MKYFIITGTSRGIGESIAEQLMAPDHHLFCISREKNMRLLQQSSSITYLAFDLNQVDQIEALMEQIFQSIDKSHAEGIYLINNASMIAPVAFIDTAEAMEITRNIQVNLLAPILLSASFIKHTKHGAMDKRIVNISSASARNHLPGMSLYSAAKAGLDVFSQCVGLEQNSAQAPVGIVSIWPGMIDTELQREARTQDKAVFPSADVFDSVKESGMLTTPEDTARQIITFLFKKDFEHGEVVDIYDYSKLTEQR
ncbi:short-chain dehydrogenase/reductase SDR [Paenibacillus curdlanolyticus YK9]|uniref:Short-chain dehydrogenase/reductase SDR n=1 Tax=Paenibacillus curdlanolyticus YK9 TaxID=717606 RepID=E0IGF2_9BACL|nr:(S)-benzoin forming benzil reductase [Paenibacillus curdlanolyticus]EFM08452.1 short-chain dehydrogenase/reductase SDR [Paenibacillus curdlanolyticus YK9]